MSSAGAFLLRRTLTGLACSALYVVDLVRFRLVSFQVPLCVYVYADVNYLIRWLPETFFEVIITNSQQTPILCLI